MSLQDLSPHIKRTHGTTWKRMSHAGVSHVLWQGNARPLSIQRQMASRIETHVQREEPFHSSAEVAALSALRASSFPPLSDCSRVTPSFPKSDINNTFSCLFIYVFIYTLLQLRGAKFSKAVCLVEALFYSH